jgi:hypothetical protein
MARARLMVATGLYGDADAAGLPHAYAGTLYMLATQIDVACQDQHWSSGDIELDPTPYPDCIEHARNNLVRLFLAHPRDYTHLLFWDSDVKARPKQLAGAITAMVKADKPIVGCPYIQKALFWEQGARAVRELLHDKPDAGVEEIERTMRGWSVRYVPDPRVTPFGERDGDLVEMPKHVPIGFGLIRRDVLEKMTSHYADALGYDLVNEGVLEHHVGLFHTTIEGRRFAMEDFAFCDRWKALGGRLFMYVGEHAPLEHLGRTAFKGTREALLGDWRGR